MKPNREMPDWKISNSISHVDAFCRFRFFPPEALPSRLSSSAIPTTHAIVAANTEQTFADKTVTQSEAKWHWYCCVTCSNLSENLPAQARH